MIAALLAAATALVLQATPKRAYLGAGASDGLAVGVRITAAKGKRSCTVERVAEHKASCAGDVRAGDSFILPERPEQPKSRVPAPPLSAAATERRRAALAGVHPPLVEFAAPSVEAEPVRPKIARVAIAHTTWAQRGATPFQEERADALLRAPIAGPVRLDADLSAQRWSALPASARFRPDDRWRLYVREAALSAAAGAGARASLGRLRPYAPGATAVDGVFAGWKFAGGSELGLYGGALPDPFTTAPATDRGTAGASWRVLHEGDAGDALRFARHQGRAAVIALPGGDKRYEMEGDGVAQLGNALDVSGDLRLAAGAFAPAAAIDALRIDVAARLGGGVRLNAAVRHEALPFPVDALAGQSSAEIASAFSGGPSRHADFSATWDATDRVRVGAYGGLAVEAGSGLDRQFAGPELSLPALFGRYGSLGAGYLEERGWLAGRSAWAQAQLTPGGSLQAIVRASWSLDRRTSAPGSTQEVGLFAGASARPLPWLELRGSLLGRAGSTGGNDAAGLVASLSAAGEF